MTKDSSLGFSWACLGLALTLAGCASSGSWKGAEAEKAYDKELEASRLAAIRNSDDYYQYHKDGVIYVLSDKADVANFLKFNEIPKTVTMIGGGPAGERVVFSLTKNEAKAMETKVGFKGGAQQMFEGTLQGYEKEFYGEVMKADRYHVFGNWAELQSFLKSGAANSVSTGSTADGKPVVFTTANPEVLKRFKELHG